MGSTSSVRRSNLPWAAWWLSNLSIAQFQVSGFGREEGPIFVASFDRRVDKKKIEKVFVRSIGKCFGVLIVLGGHFRVGVHH